MFNTIKLKVWGRRLLSIPAYSRSLSITCRGKPISREELFTYTNGRFFINEAHAFKRRYVRFDVDKLCTIAATAGGPFSPIQAIEKMEGGLSKAMVMRKDDGTEFIAKIPFPIAGPPKYTTASEVAVLQYLRMHTQIPVPRVLSWSSDGSNSVGAEYIIMERAPGVQLFEAWGTMNDYDRFVLVQQVTGLEGELAAIRFPASGNLYLRDSLTDGETRLTLSPDADPSGQFCIGPSCERGWANKEIGATTSLTPSLDRGPWSNLSSYGTALVEREIARVEHKTRDMSERPCESVEEKIAVLKMASEVMSRLNSGTLMDRFSHPVLWHTDLHMGNIFVSGKEPTKIVSLIDWQSTVVAPLYLQSRFPDFLSVDEDFVLDSSMPELPQGYESMDDDDKRIADFKLRDAKMAKVYEVATSVHNPQAYKALFMPPFLQDLFVRSGEVSEEGLIPLHACLIQVAEAWEDIGFLRDCPLSFCGEIQKHSQQFQQYHSSRRIQEIARKLLDTDSEGWIPPHLDFVLKQRQNKELLEEFMRRSNEFNMSPEEVRRIWPF
ncbi:kinase-like domain-containing protein [Pyrenochaeta sp. MPI-SDFR-AT-0127]|nr:kinase-like domain-containing protein [Pyrenochaeta sp. MPI-SDFR-AT-0127]